MYNISMNNVLSLIGEKFNFARSFVIVISIINILSGMEAVCYNTMNEQTTEGTNKCDLFVDLFIKIKNKFSELQFSHMYPAKFHAYAFL